MRVLTMDTENKRGQPMGKLTNKNRGVNAKLGNLFFHIENWTKLVSDTNNY